MKRARSTVLNHSIGKDAKTNVHLHAIANNEIVKPFHERWRHTKKCVKYTHFSAFEREKTAAVEENIVHFAGLYA